MKKADIRTILSRLASRIAHSKKRRDVENQGFPQDARSIRPTVLGRIRAAVRKTAMADGNIANSLGLVRIMHASDIARLERLGCPLSSKEIRQTMHAALSAAATERLQIHIARRAAGESDDPSKLGDTAISYGILWGKYDIADLLLLEESLRMPPRTFARKHWNHGLIINGVNAILGIPAKQDKHEEEPALSACK